MSAGQFLALLGGRFTFQTLDDSPRKLISLLRTLHGSLAEHAETIANLNARGAGVFVMVNEGVGMGRRTAANVLRVRALFVDLDGASLEPVQAATLQPHCIIETSPSRWHAYWRVSDCQLEQFKPLQQALAVRFNGDASVNDLCRVMRLPGFEHRKRDPFKSRIVTLSERAPYKLAELLQAFDLRPPTPQPKAKRTLPDTIPEGERNPSLLSLAAGLVRKGHDALAVNTRLQRINAERCQPPLCASEVDAIAARAVGYGSDGFTALTHKLQDSPEWKMLPPPAQCIIVAALRRFDGSNNGNISLPWADFKERIGFRNEGAFYRHRAAAELSGILIETRKGTRTQRGITPTLYAIAKKFLHDSQPAQSAASATCTIRQPYIDKQPCVAVAAAGVSGRRRRKQNSKPKAA